MFFTMQTKGTGYERAGVETSPLLSSLAADLPWLYVSLHCKFRDTQVPRKEVLLICYYLVFENRQPQFISGTDQWIVN